MLVCLDENGKPRGIGFRLETPESMNQDVEPSESQNQGANTNSKEGIHDFHHAQLIRKFGNKLDSKLKIECPSWLPQSQPSFPLPAKCPVTLLLCLIVTLYGRKCYNKFVSDHLNQYGKSAVKPYEKKLEPWVNWEQHQKKNVSRNENQRN